MITIVLAILQIGLLGISDQSKTNRVPTTKEVRRLASSRNNLLAIIALVEFGEAAFPAYEDILRDSKSSTDEIAGVLAALSDVKADKRQFLPIVVNYLSRSESAVRWPAVALMEQIGTPEEGAILVALLSDQDQFIRYAAAKALAATGGRRELIAVNAWLRTGGAFRDDKVHLNNVKKCRDELEKRLKENPVPKGLRN